MIKKLLFLITLVLLNFNNTSFALYGIDPLLESKYNSIIDKLDKKYNNDSQKQILGLLNKKIQIILTRKNLKTNERKLINDLSKLINETLYDIYIDETSYSTKQKILEKQYIYNFEKELNEPIIPGYIENFTTNSRKIIIVNDNYEFIQGDDIKRLNFSKYYELEPNNLNGLNGKNGFILYLSGLKKYILVTKYELERKIPYSEASDFFKFSSSDKSNIFEETLNFYTYNVPNFLFIDDKYGFYISSLISVGINTKEYGIHRNNSGKYTFIKNYQKVNLINKDIVYGVAEKEKFLENVKNDKKIILEDTNKYFGELKSITENLTSGLSKEQKIKKIYEWVLINVEYSTNFNLDDYKIYSGISTYQNKEGVCEGYVKLMAYMLNFAGVEDVEVLRGKVIDAQDFPQVGHAWLRIGENYYDPTFDDPIGAELTRKYDEYKYYALPQDLFYTNRYDLNLTPKELETTSLEYRTSLISQNLYKLSDKYKNDNYLILNDSSFRKKYGILANEIITVEKLIDVVPMFEVENYRFLKDGITKHITNINYFEIDNNNVNLILSQINYDMDSRYLFKWKNNNGSYKYIISDTITLN